MINRFISKNVFKVKLILIEMGRIAIISENLYFLM